MKKTKDIERERIRVLNQVPGSGKGKYVLYWMQAAQREHHNPALEYAVHRANDLNQPLLVGFGLTHDYPEANLRHYRFMLQGLVDTRRALGGRGIKLVVRQGSPDVVALELGREASLIVTDLGYTRIQREWRQRIANEATCPVFQVETNLIVPVEIASNKREYAARTIRSKVHKHYYNFLNPLTPAEVRKQSLPLHISGMEIDRPDTVCEKLKLDRSVEPIDRFVGGQSEAKRIFKNFIRDHLAYYAPNRNQPQTNDVSLMSMYLHFGHISPVWLALQMEDTHDHKEGRNAYIEELLVRRELAHNFTYFEPNYDKYVALPKWARVTLEEHRNDRREYIYTREQLENANTHDPYWNAAMKEMRHTGYMHNYMRMYWGKKILEWTNVPEYGYKVALHLNNKYFIDGRDPNSYAGVAWVFGLHDRPWVERPVFGKVRYMSASGLERKCDPTGYVRKVNELLAE